jgi:hypothetical protein
VRSVVAACSAYVNGSAWYGGAWGAAILDAASPGLCIAVAMHALEQQRDRIPSLHACIEGRSCKLVVMDSEHAMRDGR